MVAKKGQPGMILLPLRRERAGSIVEQQLNAFGSQDSVLDHGTVARAPAGVPGQLRPAQGRAVMAWLEHNQSRYSRDEHHQHMQEESVLRDKTRARAFKLMRIAMLRVKMPLE